MAGLQCDSPRNPDASIERHLSRRRRWLTRVRASGSRGEAAAKGGASSNRQPNRTTPGEKRVRFIGSLRQAPGSVSQEFDCSAASSLNPPVTNPLGTRFAVGLRPRLAVTNSQMPSYLERWLQSSRTPDPKVFWIGRTGLPASPLGGRPSPNFTSDAPGQPASYRRAPRETDARAADGERGAPLELTGGGGTLRPCWTLSPP